jgi:CofH subfamily radical SAM domain protein
MSVGADGSGSAGWLEAAAATPGALSDEAYVALLGAEGGSLETLCELADGLRHDRVGDVITFAVNRNLETSAVADDAGLLAELLDEAWSLGATEICLQGSLSPERRPGDGYLELVAAICGRLPAVHLHAFRPAEVLDGAARLGLTPREFLSRARRAGLGSVPGTGARILDDEIRAALTAGTDIPAASWIELIATAHAVGLFSTATMIYGHLETPAQQVAHLRTLGAMQAGGGRFSELILMPIQPAQVPARLAGQVRYADVRETRALHAVARLLLAGRIDHIQAPWPKVGLELTRELLRGGADDVGGILLDGTLAPGAGPEAGNSLSIGDVESLADGLGRSVRQRTTLYGEPSAERLAVVAALRSPA